MNKKGPFQLNVQPDVVYSWCSCGSSGKDPLCDGSHMKLEGGKRSVKFQSDQTKEIWLCGCKETKTPPYCDGSHKN